MAGVPVWLASISRRSTLTGRRLATEIWQPPTMADSLDLLRRVVGPAGDATHERAFRMQITTCLHRALTDAEIAALPPYFHAAEPTDLAGGPVEILYETVEGLPSTRPCHDPRRHPLDPSNPMLWLPLDCGACPPCRARAKLDRKADRDGRSPLFMDDLLKQAGV